jgi:hypothetical protein
MGTPNQKHLEIHHRLWDSPTVKLVSDDRCRLASRDLFKPNTPYSAELKADGRVVLTELVPAEAPLVRARKVNGRWVGAEGVKLDPKAVVDAIRQDRER